jgi:TonB-linked SusC/RagA family outer membrane protein
MKNKNGIKKALGFLMLCFFFVAVSVGAYAQKTVTGEVKDEGGLPLPGVSVIIKGTSLGTVTGIDGDYSISNVNDDATLVFSFVGMESQEVAVGTQTTINVTMNTSTIGLEEVVAIGYGTQKKANLTGSVGVATAERLENRPITSAGQGLQGVIPSLNVTIRNGDPTRSADFNIRGYESINGGSPLILIDGVPGDMDKLNPNDIESITVLKDAAAAAIYGARAAFGVILVETKKGKAGKINVTLSAEESITKPIFLIDPVTDPYKAAVAWNTATERTSGTQRYDDAYLEGLLRWRDAPTFENEWGVYDGSLRHYGYTDYKDMTVADWSLQQKYDMNISGATEDASYYVSFGYIDKEGWANLPRDKNFMYKRYNVLSKVDFKINDWISLDEQISWSAEHNDQPHFYNWDVNINTVARVQPNHMVTFPDLPYYLEPGDHDQFAPYIGKYFLSLNALPYWEDGGRDTETEHRLLLKQGVTLTPLKGLRVRGDFSYSTYRRERQDVASKIEGIATTDLTKIYLDNGFSGDDWIRNYSNYNQYYSFQTYAEYTVQGLDNHDIKAMVGFSQEWGRNTYVGAQAYSLLTPLVTDLNATTGSQRTYGSKSELALRGVFYRLNYSYKDRYLLEANGRYDGTSRFPKDDRFGFFPSLSVGWRISNEPFMESASNWLDNLKLRFSYGELGNQILVDNNGNQIYYPAISTMGVGSSNYMMSSAGRIPYVSASGLVSPTLTWETVESKNFGFDITTLNQRMDVSFDYFIRDTKDMLMDVTYPSLLGTDAPQSNAADLRNKGWELAATWRDRVGQDWSYSVTLALSDSKAEITKYDNPTGDISEYYVGQQIGEIWGYVTEGIFQTDDEVASHADQSQLGANWRAGDIKYKDLNGDGKINAGSGTLDDPGDRKILGYNRDRYNFGLNPEVQYKNWTLNLFFQGRLKRDYLPSNGNWNAFYPFNAGHIEDFYITDTWSEDNRDAYFAAPTISTDTKKNIQPQSRYVQDASYIRLKNVTLSYFLPDNLINKIGVGRAQVYLSGMNLWEATGMRSPLDPEQTSIVTQEYYFDRVYTLGVKVTF